MKHDQISYLEKIANELVVDEPMNPDPMPSATPAEVAGVQAANTITTDDLQQIQEENALLEEAAAQIIAEVNSGEALSVPDTAGDVVGNLEQQQVEEVENMDQEPVVSNPETEQVIANPEPEPVVANPEAEQDVATDISDEELAQLLANVDEGELQAALNEKVAQELYELGTLAKVVDLASGSHGEQFQKQAFEVIEYISQNENQYYEGIQKLATDLFGNEENAKELFTPYGVLYTFEQLAHVDDEGFLKQANEGAFDGLRMAVGNAIGNAKEKIIDAAKSVKELGSIEGEIKGAKVELDALRDQMLTDQVPLSQVDSVLSRVPELEANLERLKSRRNLGAGIIGTGAALGVGGAILGGNKVYNMLKNNDEVLQQEKTSGTLDTEYEKLGGITMDKQQQLTRDFLKLAGAAVLISIADDKEQTIEMRKEAAATFNEIAGMGRKDMDEAFVKVAAELYPREHLEEIVSNQHTDLLLDKVAFYLQANELSVDELEKTANAGGVMATKNVGAGLADAASNIQNTIKEEKSATEGAGRDYVGDTNNGPGKVGGDLVGTMAGYNVVNNPAAYGVAKTASEQVEVLFMQKQAAAQQYVEADQKLKALLGEK